MGDPNLARKARELLNEGKLTESLSVHEELVREGSQAAVGHYGIGYIKFKLDDLETAAVEFRRCLKRDPRNANATYYLGVIAELEHQPEIARGYFQQTLSFDPQHAAALRKLSSSGSAKQDHIENKPVVPSPPEPVVRTTTHQESQTHLGFFGLLQTDPSPVAKQIVDLIGAVNMSTRPRLSAYLGRILALCSVPVLGFILLMAVNPRETVEVWLLIMTALLVWLAALVTTIVRIKTTHISFDQGRVLLSRGWLRKQVSNIELYRVVDVKTRRTRLNSFTKDGSLILLVEHSGRHSREVELRGLATWDKLEHIFEILRSLVLLMRTTNYGKGIIY